MSNLTNKWSQQPEDIKRPDFSHLKRVLAMENPKTWIYVPIKAGKREIQERIEHYLQRFQESQHNSVNRNGGR